MKIMIFAMVAALVVFVIVEYSAYQTPTIKWQAHASRGGKLFVIRQRL